MFFKVLTNALVFVTNQQLTINECAAHKPDVVQLADIWSKFQGYNETKRKKVKEQQMTSPAPDGHAAALFQVCLKPCMEANNNMEMFGI